ncbi:PAH2 domain-containing protein [Auricularia subglabra TFB-10046 SS5]|nr:PAH2 domain-containing protein [Auricularia subglabra TFB-10046 SS5]
METHPDRVVPKLVTSRIAEEETVVDKLPCASPIDSGTTSVTYHPSPRAKISDYLDADNHEHLLLRPNDDTIQESIVVHMLGRRGTDVSEARSYLNTIQAEFQDYPGVYQRFISIMTQFETDSQISTSDVVERVVTLFSGHPGLIERFILFLPSGFHIRCEGASVSVTIPSATRGHDGGLVLPLPASEPELDLTEALLYLDLVKARVDDRREVYNKFCNLMLQFKREEIDMPGVLHRVSSLFANYPDLIDGFNVFLPDGYQLDQ